MLAEVALARRNRLGMTQRNVADSGGPSAPTVRALETQSSMMTPRSLRKLEAALGWALGTSRILIEGLEPERQDEWSGYVSDCVHNPPITAEADFINNLRKVMEDRPDIQLKRSNKEDPIEQKPIDRERYEQLDISLSHATYLLSQLKRAQENGDDAAFQEGATSLHYLIRSMHYSVMQELSVQ